MITLMILAALLLVGIILMNEYGWADLTGKTRNSVVFETRNKSYGAYEIREKYSHRLLLAFFGSLAFITLAAFTPKFFPKAKAASGNESGHNKVLTIENPKLKEKEKEKKPEEILENKVKEKSAKRPDISTVAVVKPKPTDIPQVKDTTTKPKDAIVSTFTHISNDTSGIASNFPPKKVTGGGGECLDCPEKKKSDEPMDPPTVTKQAEFDYMNFFRKNLQIPREVYEMGMTGGKIYVGFVVDEEGNVTNVKIKRGLTPLLDDEVKRVASSMPKWKPAQFNENNVKVRMVIPVNIVLN